MSAHPISGRNEISLTVKQRIPFKEGGLEDKHRIEATITLPDSDKSKNVSLIERGWMGAGDDYINKWKQFNSVGLPVVSTIRRTDKGTILLTDVKADGSEVFGGSLRSTLKNIHNLRSSNPLDQRFLEIINDGNIEQIQSQVADFVERATKAFIALPSDGAFELIVHPNGTWNLITLDLRRAEINQNKSSYESLKEKNQLYADNFLLSLKKLGEMLGIHGQLKQINEKPNDLGMPKAHQKETSSGLSLQAHQSFTEVNNMMNRFWKRISPFSKKGPESSAETTNTVISINEQLKLLAKEYIHIDNKYWDNLEFKTGELPKGKFAAFHFNSSPPHFIFIPSSFSERAQQNVLSEEDRYTLAHEIGHYQLALDNPILLQFLLEDKKEVEITTSCNLRVMNELFAGLFAGQSVPGFLQQGTDLSPSARRFLLDLSKATNPQKVLILLHQIAGEENFIQYSLDQIPSILADFLAQQVTDPKKQQTAMEAIKLLKIEDLTGAKFDSFLDSLFHGSAKVPPTHYEIIKTAFLNTRMALHEVLKEVH